MNVNLICLDKHQHGNKITLPMAGEVQLDSEGLVSVDENVANFMVENGGGGWEISSGKAPKETKAPTTEKGKTETAAKNKKAEETKAPKVTKESLAALSLDELLELAKAGGYDKEEWKKFKTSEKLMANYLLKKLA